MIKELDHLIETKNPDSSNSLHLLDTDPACTSLDLENKHLSPLVIQDYQALLTIAIEIFQNNHNPQSLLSQMQELDTLLLNSHILKEARTSPKKI